MTERYTYQQFTHDVMTDTDAPLKRGGPVTKSSMVENPTFVSALVVAQHKLPKEYIDHHIGVLQGSEEGMKVLQGLGIIGQSIK